MPALANEQHESFCQHVAAGLSMTEASKRSGHPHGSNNYGKRLMDREEITHRVIELRSLATQPIPQGNQPTLPARSDPSELYTSRPWVVIELVAVHSLARKAKDYGVSHAVLKTLAQIGGHLNEANNRLSDIDRKQSIGLLGISEIHAMLTRQVGSVPRQDRAVLIEAAPELAELIESTPDVPQTPTEPSE